MQSMGKVMLKWLLVTVCLLPALACKAFDGLSSSARVLAYRGASAAPLANIEIGLDDVNALAPFGHGVVVATQSQVILFDRLNAQDGRVIVKRRTPLATAVDPDNNILVGFSNDSVIHRYAPSGRELSGITLAPFSSIQFFLDRDAVLHVLAGVPVGPGRSPSSYRYEVLRPPYSKPEWSVNLPGPAQLFSSKAGVDYIFSGTFRTGFRVMEYQAGKTRWQLSLDLPFGVAADSDGSMWMVVGGDIMHWSASGTRLATIRVSEKDVPAKDGRPVRLQRIFVGTDELEAEDSYARFWLYRKDGTPLLEAVKTGFGGGICATTFLNDGDLALGACSEYH